MTERCNGLPLKQESAVPLDPRNRNYLLASLSQADFDSLRPNLRAFEMKSGVVLVEAGAPLSRVYFPHAGIVSLVVRLAKGEAVEAAMVGRDGVFGAGAALEGEISANTAIVQLEGRASTLETPQLRYAAEQSATLRSALMRYEQFLYVQALQSAACNASHTVLARLSRWLLRARDLSGSNTLPFSQESLAQMLGRHRNSVSIVANSLQQQGIIFYSRGQIEIVDLEGLMKCSCECYLSIRTRGDKSVGNDSLPGLARSVG